MTDISRTTPGRIPGFQWTKKNLLTTADLTQGEHIMQTASSFKEVSSRNIKKVPALRGKTVANLFFENSTRTRASFELAAKRLSADIMNFSSTASSTSKGESLVDTARNIEAMNIDIIVVRHSSSGSADHLSRFVKAGVVNAGDGTHEHPTQALLDLYTILEAKKSLAGLKICFIGDILHSRVARSNIWALNTMGAKVTVCGPPTLIPKDIERFGVKVSFDLDEVIGEMDVLYLLRIQFERQHGKYFPSLREYAGEYGINLERMSRAKKDVLIMHPGPVNRGVELSAEVADGRQSLILNQVTNGVAVRMAVLYLISGVRSGQAAA
jgi:aspartate carbamoyltransferase catalytic subunit